MNFKDTCKSQSFRRKGCVSNKLACYHSLIPNQYKTDLFTNKGFCFVLETKWISRIHVLKTCINSRFVSLFSYQSSLCCCPQQQLVYTIMSPAVCQQLFYLFLKLFKKLKLYEQFSQFPISFQHFVSLSARL